MNTAKEAVALLTELKEQGKSKAEIVRALANFCLGWPYVYAAAGEDCTPEWRRNRMGYSDEKYAKAIKEACPVLNGSVKQDIGFNKLIKTSSCSGCKWEGVLCFDCRGFTRKLLAWADITLAGGGATSQWEIGSNWIAKGEIKDIPLSLVCCVFKRKENKMSHTGMHMQNGHIIHCSTIVKEDVLPGKPAWTHWGIPAGLYSSEELRKAGVKVDESKNIPTLRRGSTGDMVEELQALLNAIYGANLDVDGVFGTNTELAVKAFQKAKSLTADGVVGPKTWAALGIKQTESTSTDSSTESSAKAIWDTLIEILVNPYAVAGLMGNLYAESSLNPKNLQNTGNKALGMTDQEYTDAVDNGNYTQEQFENDQYGYGLAQWTYRTRKASLLRYARACKRSIGDLEMQLSFLLQELDSSYPVVLERLKYATSVKEASDAILTGYEKPKNQSEENKMRRAELGQKYFDQFAETIDEDEEVESLSEASANDNKDEYVSISRLKLLEIMNIINQALEG